VRILEQEILPRFGHLPLGAITRSQLKAYAPERAADGLSANTVRNHLAPLRAVLASAVDDELLRANVAARIKRAGQPQRELRPPSKEQVQALIAGARTPEAAAIFTLAASLGLRRGELYALRWEAVDFAAGLVHVAASNDRGVITLTKTAAGGRVVPMFGSAASSSSSKRRGRLGAARTILSSRRPFVRHRTRQPRPSASSDTPCAELGYLASPSASTIFAITRCRS
jgi:integrase